MSEERQNSGQTNQSAAEERQLRKQIAIEKAASHKSQTKVVIIVSSIVLAIALTFLFITISNNQTKKIYEEAITYLNAENYSAAYDTFLRIQNYGNVKDIIAQNEGIQDVVKKREEVLKNYQTRGNIVTFGRYNNEPINWIVLQCDGEKTLLISEKCVFKSSMHEMDQYKYKNGYSWETASLRAELNGPFLEKSFTESEQKAITTVYSDKVYIFSTSEVSRYFKTREEQTLYDEKGNIVCWWTTSKGHSNLRNKSWMDGFYVYYIGNPEREQKWNQDFSDSYNGVRPVIWVNLKSRGIYDVLDY